MQRDLLRRYKGHMHSKLHMRGRAHAYARWEACVRRNVLQVLEKVLAAASGRVPQVFKSASAEIDLLRCSCGAQDASRLPWY